MNLRNILANLWLILCFAFSIVKCQLSEREQIACKFIANLDDDLSKDAKFTVVVDSISMNDSLTNAPDISIFMFAKRDLKKFETNFDMHFYQGSSGMWMHEDQDSPLNVTVKPEYANDNVNYYFGTLETSKPYKDISEGKVLATLNVTHSGDYCAVISTPQGLERLRAREIALHSYGYLPYDVYISLQSNLVYCLILTLLIGSMGVFFYRYAKPNVNEKFSPSRVSLVFKSFLLFVYLPIYISSIMRYGCTIYVRNSPREYGSLWLIKILNWVDANIQITNRYIIFLLAVGYGTIYSGLAFGYDTPSSSPTSIHTPMPARKWNRGVLLYGLNIICFSLLELSKKYGHYFYRVYDYFEGYLDDNHINAYYCISNVTDFLSVSFPLYWMTISLVHYLRNFLAIHKGSSKVTDSNQHLVKLRESYRRSIVLILFFPVISGSIYLGIIVKEISSLGRKFDSSPYPEYIPFQLDESDNYVSKGPYILIKVWINYLTVLSSMLFTYYVWMMDNVGIKLQPTIGSEEYHEIPMSDFN